MSFLRRLLGLEKHTNAIITNWKSYTPTLSTGFGTGGTSPTNVGGNWRRVGDTMEIQGYLTTGTLTAAIGYIGLPLGYTVNHPKAGQNIGNRMYFVGTYILMYGSGYIQADGGWGVVATNDSVSDKLQVTTKSANTGDLEGGYVNGYMSSGHSLMWQAKVPIFQWTANFRG